MQVFRARVQLEQGFDGLVAYVDLTRVKSNMTIAQARSIRVYSDRKKTIEYPRHIVSKKKMYLKLGASQWVFLFIDGVSPDYDVAETDFGRNSCHAKDDIFADGSALVDSTGNRTIGQIGTVPFVDGLTGKAFSYPNNSTYPRIIPSGRNDPLLRYTDKFCVRALVRCDDIQTGKNNALVSKGNSWASGAGFIFEYEHATHQWSINKPATPGWKLTATSRSQPIDDYTFIEFEKNPTEMIVYIDGVENNRFSQTDDFTDVNDAIRIGSSLITPRKYWCGTIAEFGLNKNVNEPPEVKYARALNIKDQSAFWGEWDDVTYTHIDGLTGEKFDTEQQYLEHTNKVTGVKPTDLHHHGSIGVTVAEEGLKRTGHLNEDKQALIATARDKVIEHNVDHKRARFLSKIVRGQYVEI